VQILKSPIIRWVFLLSWLLGVGGLTFLWHLGSVALIDETEPIFAETARQMLERGDWLTPIFNDDLRFDKPPLIYWLIAVCYQVIGVNEWAARMPSALSAIAVMAGCFYVLWHYGVNSPDRTDYNKRWLLAALGSGIVALNPLMLAWGRVAVADLVLVGTLSLSLLAFFVGYAQAQQAQQKYWFAGFYSFLGFATLAKGPVAIALEIPIVLGFVFYCGNLSQVWRELRPLRGLLLTLTIALPWFVWATLQHGKLFIDQFFVYHNLERFTSVVSRHGGGWYYYLLVLLVGFMPWSAFLPGAIAHLRLHRRKQWQQVERSQHLGIFAFFWLAGVFVFFTIASTKLPSYILPLIPPAAILVAQFGSALTSGIGLRVSRWLLMVSGGVSALLFAAIATVFAYLPGVLSQSPANARFLPLLTAADIPFRGMFLGGAIGLAIGLLLITRKPQWLWLPNLTGMLGLTGLVIVPLIQVIDLERQQPLKQLAQQVKRERQPGEELYLLGHRKSSVVFYSADTVHFVRKRRHIAEIVRETQTPSPSLLILVKNEAIPKLKLVTNSYQVMGQAGQYSLIRAARAPFHQHRDTPVSSK